MIQIKACKLSEANNYGQLMINMIGFFFNLLNYQNKNVSCNSKNKSHAVIKPNNQDPLY